MKLRIPLSEKEFNRKIETLFLHARTKFKMLKNPFRLYLYEKNGKRYLVAFHSTFKGVKWFRRFEIVSELNPATFEPIEFKGIKVDDCKKQPSEV